MKLIIDFYSSNNVFMKRDIEKLKLLWFYKEFMIGTTLLVFKIFKIQRKSLSYLLVIIRPKNLL